MAREPRCRIAHFRAGASELVVASFALPAAPKTRLSETERVLLAGILRGKSEPELARERARSLPTVRHQVESIYRKLGVHSRAELLKACSAHTGEAWKTTSSG
jgi:DNA-binding NarL/FixJ family response regulator